MKTHCDDCGNPFPIHPAGYFGGAGYADFMDGKRVCYPCSDKRQVEKLRDRSKPMVGYLDANCENWTTWTGGKLGRVIQSRKVRSGFHSSWQTIVRVLDVHGKLWHGRGAGEQMCINLRPMKGK